jgi:AcrR family transcriptional regulator
VAGRDTQDKLIETAERLFAENGFDGVTFKQITTEAGQRNASALQYHFGSKQALVRAIVLKRSAPVDARRCALLDDLEARGGTTDLRAVVTAMVRPLADELDDGSGRRRNYYIAFLAQVLSNPRSSLTQLVARENNKGVMRAALMAAALVPALPPELMRVRLFSLMGFVVGALADYERGLHGAPGERPPAGPYVANLVDMIVGMLEQPMSEATARERASATVATETPAQGPAEGRGKLPD